MPGPPDAPNGGARQPTHVLAAGGLLEHVDAAGVLRIAVLHRTRYEDRDGEPGDWVLPKGKSEAGETLEATALREVAEETGFRGRIVEPAFPCEYEAAGVPKLVLFFRMERLAEASGSDRSEVREVVWLAPREALERLTYDNERGILRQAYPDL